MKKTYLLCLCLTIYSFSAFAQQDSLLTDKKGRVLLPQKGDFAIGMGTNGVFDYIGNLFRNDGWNSFRFNLINGNQLYGKYFLSEQKAVRSRVNIFSNNFQSNNYPEIDAGQITVNTRNHSSYGVDLTLGLERRRGSGRLQFSYGPEASIGTSMTKITNSSPHTSYYQDLKEEKTVNGLILGARVFTGIEYFFMPKVSIGCEIGFGIRSNFMAKQTFTTFEGREASVNTSATNIGSDTLGGQLFLLFHL